MEQIRRKAVAMRNVLMSKEIGARGNTMGVYLSVDGFKFPVRLKNIRYEGTPFEAPDIDVEAEVLYEEAPIGMFDILQHKACDPLSRRSDADPWADLRSMILAKTNPHVTPNPAKYDPIEKVIFNNPATIVFWKDGSKTVVKAQNNEIFDPEKGLAMAIAKKMLGNEGNYFERIKKWVTAYQEQAGVGVIDLLDNEEAPNE